MKKGQIQIIFTWIFVLILIGFILIYGIKTVKKTQDLGNQAVIINFFKNLDSRINTYYYLSKDSSGVEEFNLPSDVRCVCFTKDYNLDMGNERVECDNINGDFLKELVRYDNVFLFSDKSYNQERTNVSFLYLDNNPTCVEIKGGILRIRLENLGLQGVNITNA